MDTYKSQKIWIKSVLITTVFLSIIWLLFSVRYETNDDSAIMYMIAGYQSGSIEIDSIFSGVVWGTIVGGLYKLLPYLPWYTICCMFIILLSHVVILKTVLQRLTKKSSFIVFLIVYMGGAIYSASFLQFTTTALWPGIAACVLGIGMSTKKSNYKREIFEVILLVSLVAISSSIRKVVGMAILVFLGISFVINCNEKHKKEGKKKAVLVFGSTILVLLMVSGITSVYENGTGWKEWRAYHEERAAYKDYDAVSYEENSAIYEEVGWDQNLYNLVDKWFFMDPRVNKDNFETLNKYKQEFENEEVDLVKFCEETFQCVILALRSFRIARIMLLQMSILSLYLLWRSVTDRNKFLFFNVLIIVFCAIAMLMYLGIEGRLPLRVFQVCVLPAIVLLGYLYAIDSDTSKSERGKYVNFFVVFVLFVCMVGSGLYTYKQTLNESIAKGTDIRMKMENYAVNHPDNIYVYDDTMSSGADPFVTYPNGKPTNYIFWGGSTMFSPVHERRLELYGKKDLYADVLLEENVYFVSQEELREDALLVEYMNNNFEDIDYKKVNDIKGCQIYKFFVEDKKVKGISDEKKKKRNDMYYYSLL